MSIYENVFMLTASLNQGDQFMKIRIIHGAHSVSHQQTVYSNYVDLQALMDHDFTDIPGKDSAFWSDDLDTFLKITEYNGNYTLKFIYAANRCPAMIFAIPDFNLVEIAQQYIQTGEIHYRQLIHSPSIGIKMNFSNAQKAIHQMITNSLMRRAFCKQISRSFQWIGTTEIQFFNDFMKGSFFFAESRGDRRGLCGGFICHSFLDENGREKYRYSIHT